MLAKIIKYGGEEMTQSAGAGCSPLGISDLSLLGASSIPVVGPIWRGVFNTSGSSDGSWKGLEAFMPKTSYSKVVNIVRALQPSLYLHLEKRDSLWPKNFDELGAADCNIEIYIFPQFSSFLDRCEAEYNNLVEYMISNDLAMTATLANLKLMVFTSLEITAPEKQKIQGKYYLWGAFEKVSSEIPSKRYKPSVAKSRMGKGLRAVGCQEKQSISTPCRRLMKIGTNSKKTKKAVSLLKCSRIPSFRPECKRARSKKGKKLITRPSNDQEADQTYDKPSQAETSTILEASLGEVCLPQENARLLNDTTGTSENVVNIEASAEGSARLAGQGPEELVSPLITPVKERSENHEALSIPDVSCCHTLAKRLKSLNIEGNAEKTVSDKPMIDLVILDQEPVCSSKLGEKVNECVEDTQNRIVERKTVAEQPNWEDGVEIDGSNRGNVSECIEDKQNQIIQGEDQPNQEDGLKLFGVFLPSQNMEPPQLQAQDNCVNLAANSENCTISIPLVSYQEGLEEQEPNGPNPISNGENNPCINDDDPVADQQYIVDEKVLDAHKATASDGLTLLPPLEIQHDTHVEKGSCIPPVIDLEKENSSPSIASTEVIEYDDEETTISGAENIREASVTSIRASISEMAGEFHDISSNCVGMYNVNAELLPILKKILEKHGDIASNCRILPKVPLENICKVVQELESVRLRGLRSHHVNHLKSVLQLADAVGIDVEWLRKRCEVLEKFTCQLSDYPTLKSNLDQAVKDVQHKEEMLSSKRTMVENLIAEIKSEEKEFEALKEYKYKLDCAVQSINSICTSFHDKSVVDGLL
ncbi:uncharacterized protein [Spinacia oleracea]|nr:uncharacterized protein LOC110778409 isoform X2 [Spinacia oleracea]